MSAYVTNKNQVYVSKLIQQKEKKANLSSKNMGVFTNKVDVHQSRKDGTMEAVKVMKSSTNVIKTAKHEIQILKQLRRLDPNTSHVVRFNSFFFNMEDICLSFEFLDMDLHTYISEMSPCKMCLPLPEVRHITEQLVMALHHLKTIGIIHMDIKPENVMIVDHHAKPLQVKLVDFGGAQMSGNIDFETCIFTQVYSSAEVLLESEMNEALDMWSLGVTAFELAVGTVLFPYNRCYSIINSIVKILGHEKEEDFIQQEHMSGNIDFETCIFTQVYSSAEVLLESEMNEALDMWSLGVTAFELAVGTVLFPYNRCYSIINSIVKILGQPPDHVLDKGQQTEEFFNRRTNDYPRWTIKTAEEYGIRMLLVQQEHATGLDLFMDLIKNMLQVDPNQRITPMEALQHPFFTVKEETVKELEASSMEPCVENIQLTNYAVDQLEKPEHVPPETVVSQENPAEVQPDNSGEDQLNDGFQTEDNTLNYTCFVNTLRTVGHALALPKRTEKFDWFGCPAGWHGHLERAGKRTIHKIPNTPENSKSTKTPNYSDTGRQEFSP
uniref:Protein kinase domain-containing protein n=1 Tax=Takifugu rubripes TaxID=31033 RepID=A0A674NSN3_TAKRU